MDALDQPFLHMCVKLVKYKESAAGRFFTPKSWEIVSGCGPDNFPDASGNSNNGYLTEICCTRRTRAYGPPDVLFLVPDARPEIIFCTRHT